MDFVSTSSAKKKFQISHSQNLISHLELDRDVHLGHLKPPMWPCQSRSDGFARFAHRWTRLGLKFAAHIESWQCDTSARLWKRFLILNQVQMHISISIRMGDTRFLSIIATSKPLISSPKCRICTFHTHLKSPGSKLCSALRISTLRHTYAFYVDFYVFCPCSSGSAGSILLVKFTKVNFCLKSVWQSLRTH